MIKTSGLKDNHGFLSKNHYLKPITQVLGRQRAEIGFLAMGHPVARASYSDTIHGPPRGPFVRKGLRLSRFEDTSLCSNNGNVFTILWVVLYKNCFQLNRLHVRV